MRRVQELFLKSLFIISVISMFIFAYLLGIYDLLPIFQRNILLSFLAITHVLIGLILINKIQSKKVYILSSITLTILLFFQLAAIYLSYNTINKYNENIDKSLEREVYSVITYKENPINSLDEINNDIIYYGSEENKDTINDTIDQLRKYSNNIEYKSDTLTSEIYKKLINKNIEYMMINNSKMNLVEEDLETFRYRVKVLSLESKNTDNSKTNKDDEKHSEGVVVNTQNTQREVVETEPGESFVLYISGGDSYTGLSHPSRSDVNIVVAVSPRKREVLMLSIPRDSYVYIPGLGNDKLTHAGIYGINKSIESLEHLLNLKINYYAKVNFTSLIRLVDALGGVTVKNDNEFTSRLAEIYYPKGKLNLDGEHALEFVRERYNLPNGDIDRQRNQMKVLTAMISKATSSQIVLNYNEILDATLDAVNTDLPSSVLTNIANNQIANNKSWKIESAEIIGEGRMDLKSYSMPNDRLFMFKLDEKDVENASQKILNILD